MNVPIVQVVLLGVAVESVALVGTVTRRSRVSIATEGPVHPTPATLGLQLSARTRALDGRKETPLVATGILYPAVDETTWVTANRGIGEKAEATAVMGD